MSHRIGNGGPHRAESPRTIVLLSPGLHEQAIWGEKLAVISEAKYLAREFPGATIFEFGREDLDRLAAMKVDLLISYYTGPRPPWRVDNIADYVDGVTILKVVNHGDLIGEFAEIPVDGFMTNSAAAAEVLGNRRPAAYVPLAVEDDYGRMVGSRLLGAGICRQPRSERLVSLLARTAAAGRHRNALQFGENRAQLS
jgi:hypothetical protein